MTLDAVVVGAGLSGLVCARTLVKAGATVRVLEARDRVGGRLANGTLAGATVDLGGQWISPQQPRVFALADELGVARFPQRREGRAWMPDQRGLLARLTTAFAQTRAARKIVTAARALPTTLDRTFGMPDRASLDRTARVADDRSSPGTLDRTSLEDRLATLDRESLAAYLARTIDSVAAREAIALHAELVLAEDLADISLLHYLTTLRATGEFGTPGTEYRLHGGAQLLALRLAGQIGDAIRYDMPVKAIEAGPVLAVRGEGFRERAHHVVLALPPALAAAIVVELPADMRRFVDECRPGPVVKCFAAYDRAFWRDDGWSGEAYRPRGTVRATVALDDGDGGSPSLLAFVVGGEARRFGAREPIVREREIVSAFVEQFGEAAARPRDYLEMNWGADAWSRGCVAGFPPGVLSQGARWRDPIGRIHVAGTESAGAWPGYMEGAIEAGERAAGEVLAAG